MPNSFNSFLEHTQTIQTTAVKHYHVHGQKVWLKKATKRHSSWIYVPLRWCARILDLQMLVPVPNHGGKEAILCEINRIRQLKSLKISIPEILAYREDSFLMRDAAKLGKTVCELENALDKQVDTQSKMVIYESAIHSLNNIHSKKTYLSEAFARNILVDDALNFSFIDFETDPGRILSLQDCQTRDWLCFIFSTARCFENHELNQACEMLTQGLNQNIRSFQGVCRVSTKLKWILKLKPEKLGSDGERLKKSIYLMTKLNENEPLPMI